MRRLGWRNEAAGPGIHGVLCLQSSIPCSLNSWKVPNVSRRLERDFLSCKCLWLPLLHGTCLPRGVDSTWCGFFFPVAVSCSEVIPLNFGYLSCASMIHPLGEQSFSPGLKTRGFYFLAESP